jgi:hypothetical protein
MLSSLQERFAGVAPLPPPGQTHLDPGIGRTLTQILSLLFDFQRAKSRLSNAISVEDSSPTIKGSFAGFLRHALRCSFGAE